MSVLVDTSVWSLALRRDGPKSSAPVKLLTKLIEDDSEIYVTGIILQELLQGFVGAKAQEAIVSRFGALPMLVPETADYISAAELRNKCRRKGVQIGTIDALIAQLALRYKLSLLTTDKDFTHMQKVIKFKIAK